MVKFMMVNPSISASSTTSQPLNTRLNGTYTLILSFANNFFFLISGFFQKVKSFFSLSLSKKQVSSLSQTAPCLEVLSKPVPLITTSKKVGSFALKPIQEKTYPFLDSSPFYLAKKVPTILPEFEKIHLEELNKIRAPLKDVLKSYFEIDTCGYILSPLAGANIQELTTISMERLNRAFRQVAEGGDAAFAHEIRTSLAHLGIASYQVSKEGAIATILQDPVRPNTYKEARNGTQNPPHYKSQPAYMSLWEKAIWMGYREYRHRKFFNTPVDPTIRKLSQDKIKDMPITPQQLAHYERSVRQVHSLHSKGDLFERCANLAEADDFVNGRYNMSNDILSVSLLPKADSKISMRLFTEYGGVTVGLLMAANRVAPQDFGVSFYRNACTVGSGFLTHKNRIGRDGASSYQAQKKLFIDLEERFNNGGSIDHYTPELSQDFSHWVVKKEDVRGMQSSLVQKKHHVGHNEQTFYRGAENDLCCGFFLKSNSDNLSKELREVFELQDKIRRTKGRFIPVFLLDGEKNSLEELPPDSILIKVLGIEGKVTPIVGHKSRFGATLDAAGISETIAKEMIDAAATKSLNIQSLLDLQLLMFNLRDLTGTIGVKKQNLGAQTFTYEDVRLIDNLHLVFPTIHQSQNENAERKELFLSFADVREIKAAPHILRYLECSVGFNLQRFLGVSLKDDGTPQFNPKVLDVFEPEDKKKGDYAKVLSRALQMAVLFDVFGRDTFPKVTSIVKAVRTFYPNLGIMPSGVDMILGSQQMQQILTTTGKSYPKEMSICLEPSPSLVTPQIPIPQLPQDFINRINPFGDCELPTKSFFTSFFLELGIDILKNTLDRSRWDQFVLTDPSLEKLEAVFLQAMPWFNLVDSQEASKLMELIRQTYPIFGFSVDNKDLTLVKSDRLGNWIDRKIKNQIPDTEFPFTSKYFHPQTPGGAVASPMPLRRGGAAFSAMHHPQPHGAKMGRGAILSSLTITDSADSSKTAFAIDPSRFVQSPALLELYNKLIGKIDSTDPRHPVFTRLGLINGAGVPLWDVPSEFHEGNLGKPKAPYIKLQDILGAHATELLSGPAYHPAIFQSDCQSVRVLVDPSKWQSLDQSSIEERTQRFLTHTLAFVTDGDQQVLRQNGLQYSSAVSVPMGGRIEFNPGNEKHWFREDRTKVRRFYGKQTTNPAQSAYTGMGKYSEDDLRNVQDYDALLLSDEERRIKRVSCLKSAYITVTAKGGYNSIRTPLEKHRKVLYLATAGAQFEKYGCGDFTSDRGDTNPNELDATDFIIKVGSLMNPRPLFPTYYPDGKIPAHQDIEKGNPQLKGVLGDADPTKYYVSMKDGAFFNRGAFLSANKEYFDRLVVPEILHRTQGRPFYLKATLFGGGYFAQAASTDLRQEVLHAMVQTYIHLLKEKKFPSGSVIEFPAYGEISALPEKFRQDLLAHAQASGVQIVWTPKGDVFDFAKKTTVTHLEIDPLDFASNDAIVVLGAADPMSFDGNEAPSVSVEAMMGNNSNLRGVMNAHSNMQWLNPKKISVFAKDA